MINQKTKLKSVLVLFFGFFVCTVYVYAQVQLESGVNISAVVSGSSTTTIPQSPVISGGGGGGFTMVTTATVNFSGFAYPLSHVYILKDGNPGVTTIAGPDAKFNVSFGGLNPGTYNFVIYGEDSNGVKSDTFSFPLILTAGATVDISGIFIAPTISTDKTSVKQGDTINIFGQSVPNSQIVISVHSNPETFHSINTDNFGAYLYSLDTSFLDIGNHETKAKAVSDNAISSFGKTISFNVGSENVTNKNQNSSSLRADLNGDGKVDLIDFSILAYWYGKPNPPARVDLNGDGKVDLIDFSILAYYWTG